MAISSSVKIFLDAKGSSQLKTAFEVADANLRVAAGRKANGATERVHVLNTGRNIMNYSCSSELTILENELI